MSTDKNARTMGSATARKLGGGIVGLGLMAAVLIAGNILLNNVRMRTDLTEEKLYTISAGTKNMLKNLDRKVSLKFFFSSSAPETPIFLKTFARQVEDLLKEYAIASDGKVSIVKLDPKQDSDEEDLAKGYGIAANNVGMFGPAIYFGLAAVAGESEGIIPALDPRTEGLLEYNISRLIFRVTHPDKPSVGVLSSLPVLGRQPPPQMGGFPQPRQAPQPAWLSFQDIRHDYDLRELDMDITEIPPDLSALIVVHPKDLSEKTLYAIDQFVVGGGHLLAFLDPLSIIDIQSGSQQQFGQPNASSNMEKLLTAWGIAFTDDKIVADMKAVTMLRGQDNQAEENPVFLTLRKVNGSLNEEDILTSQLDTLMFPFAGRFSDHTSSDVLVTPLITSSDQAGAVTAFSAQFGAAAIRREFKAEAIKMPLAIRVSGKLKSAFPDGLPISNEDEDDDETPLHETLTEGSSTIILVGDTDFLFDQFCVEELNFFGSKAQRPLNDNLSFFANAIELVAGSSDLTTVRSRGQFARPFDYVLRLEEDARKKWQEQEKALNDKLQTTRRQLSDMQAQKDDNQRFILNAEQQTAIQRFRDEEIAINQELKQVRKRLAHDIERLGVKVKVANIVLMPLIIAIAGILFGLYRKKRI
ncbi:MAG: Gldg family protein [Verrucomicrobia bacterium]|nr:Gldg family protein [Verrucomicrobiota bacterium]